MQWSVWLTWCYSGAVCPVQCCGPQWLLAYPCSWTAPWQKYSSGYSAWGGQALTQMSTFHRRQNGTTWGNSRDPKDTNNGFIMVLLLIFIYAGNYAKVGMFYPYRSYYTVLRNKNDTEEGKKLRLQLGRTKNTQINSCNSISFKCNCTD